MSSELVPFQLLIHMGDRDITPYVERAHIFHQRDTLFREFTLEFRAWHNFQIDEHFDIWGSYDSAEPKAELLIRNGIIPPDRQPEFTLQAGEAPKYVVKGYDYVWLMQRRCPRQTLVYADTRGGARRAVEEYNGPIGAYRVITGRSSLRRVLYHLGGLGGVNVEVQLPRRALNPVVIPPTRSYWRAMLEIARPWAPYIYYAHSTNTLFFVDAHTANTGITSSVVELTDEMVLSAQGLKSRRKTVNRVVLEIV